MMSSSGQAGIWCPDQKGIKHSELRTLICIYCGVELQSSLHSPSEPTADVRDGRRKPVPIPDGAIVYSLDDTPEKLPPASRAIHLPGSVPDSIPAPVSILQARTEAEASRKDSIKRSNQPQALVRTKTERGINGWKCAIQVHAYSCKYLVQDEELGSRKWFPAESIRKVLPLSQLISQILTRNRSVDSVNHTSHD